MIEKSTLKVENLVQRTIFKSEITGQISDGAWENTRPYDHYKDWMGLNVVIDPKHIGRNFWATKCNYNLHSLIEYVGDRMLCQARVALAFPKLVTALLDADLRIPDSEWAVNYMDRDGYDSKVKGLFIEHKVTSDAWMAAMADDSSYLMKHLRKDLAALKIAMKTRN